MSNWGNKPTPENAPKFLTEEQKAQVKATERGWELPLAGTNPDDGLMEVLVAMSGLLENVEEGEIVDTFDVFDINNWELPVKVPAARQPAVFEKTTFKNNEVLHVGTSPADFDTDHPDILTDYAYQREVMSLDLPDGGLVLTADNTIRGSIKLYINKADFAADTLKLAGFSVVIDDATGVYVTSAMMAVGIQDTAGFFWGPDVPDYVSGQTPDATYLPKNKYATLEVAIKVGEIQYIANGVVKAIQPTPSLVAGCKVQRVEIQAFNTNQETDHYFDDLTVTD